MESSLLEHSYGHNAKPIRAGDKMLDRHKSMPKSLPISQQAEYEQAKLENQKQLVEYSIRHVKKRLNLRYKVAEIKEIPYRKAV